MSHSPAQSSVASSPALSSLSSTPSAPSPLGNEKKKSSFFHPPEGKNLFQHWLIFPKLMYFLLANVIYANHAFGPKNMVKNWHMSLVEVSFLSSLIVVNFFGSLLWTWLSDRTRQHKIILLVTSVIMAALSWGFWRNPFDIQNQRLLTIVWTSCVTVLTNFFQSALFPLCDSLIMTMLAEDPTLTKDNFGYQRLFSSIGHSVTTLITGELDHRVGYWTIFVYLSVVTFLFALLVLIAMPNVAEVKGGHHGHGGGEEKKQETHVPHPTASQALPLAATPGPPAVDIRTDDGHGRSPVVIMLTNPHFLFFMLFIVAAGMTRSVMSNFQTLFVATVVTQNRSDWAAYLSIGRLASELAMFWVAKRILRGLGVYWVLLLAQVVGLLRVLGYALLPISQPMLSYYLSIPLEMLKGINSSLIASSCIRIAADMAPKHCASTAQGLFSGNFNGISSAVGALISALLFWMDRNSDTGHQYQFMFLWTVIISGIPSVLLALKFIFIDRVVGLPGLPRKNHAPGKPL